MGVTKNTALITLTVSGNQLTTINVTQNNALEQLNLDSNSGLTSIDLTQTPSLTSLSARDCNLNSVKTNNANTALEILTVSGNQLETIDVTQNTALKTLILHGNLLTTIDVTQCTALQVLAVSGNRLTTINVTKNTALTYLYLGLFRSNGDLLTTIDVTKNTALKTLEVDNNLLTYIDVTKNTALETLVISDNAFSSIDVTQNIALISLNLHGNQLTTIDVTKNTALKTLEVASNQLTYIDVTKNTALETLYIGDNNLIGLSDLSLNTALKSLATDDACSNAGYTLVKVGMTFFCKYEKVCPLAVGELNVDITVSETTLGKYDLNLEYYDDINTSLCFDVLSSVGSACSNHFTGDAIINETGCYTKTKTVNLLELLDYGFEVQPASGTIYVVTGVVRTFVTQANAGQLRGQSVNKTIEFSRKLDVNIETQATFTSSGVDVYPNQTVEQVTTAVTYNRTSDSAEVAYKTVVQSMYLLEADSTTSGAFFD